MTKTLLTTLVAVAALLTGRMALAQEPARGAGAPRGEAVRAEGGKAETGEAAGAEGRGAAEHAVPGPVIATDAGAWPGVVLIIIGTMFVLAAVIGPVARMHAPPAEMPPTHSHDEPPGASHHHGSSGTINPEPHH